MVAARGRGEQGGAARPRQASLGGPGLESNSREGTAELVAGVTDAASVHACSTCFSEMACFTVRRPRLTRKALRSTLMAQMSPVVFILAIITLPPCNAGR